MAQSDVTAEDVRSLVAASVLKIDGANVRMVPSKVNPIARGALWRTLAISCERSAAEMPAVNVLATTDVRAMSGAIGHVAHAQAAQLAWVRVVESLLTYAAGPATR